MSGYAPVAHASKGSRFCKAGVRFLGFVLSIGMLLWLLRFGDLKDFVASLQRATLSALVFTILLGYLAFPLRMEQWRLLLGMPRSVTHWKTLKAICLGHVGNVLLPMRGGEAVRAVLLSKSCAIPLALVLVSVGLNRVQDLPAILLIVAAVFALNPLDPTTIQSVSNVLGVSFTPTQTDLGVGRDSHLFIVINRLNMEKCRWGFRHP